MRVMITGASSGLGYELAKEFHKNGDSLILIARKKSLQDIKGEFLGQTLIEVDFFNDNIEEKLKGIILNGMPDIIIHSAGGKLENDTHPIDVELLKQSLNLNLFSAIQINNLFIDQALKTNSAVRIIHISSDAGITGKASPSYSISKGALNTYIQNVGRIYSKNNIMICGLIFGIFEHKNSVWSKKKKENPEYYEEVKNSSTLKRFADVKEVAEVVMDISKSKSMLYSAELINLTAGNI